jgi:hypothetical protein
MRTDRIDEYLTGTLGMSSLTARERAEAESLEQVADEVRSFVRERPVPDITSAVMSQIVQGRSGQALKGKGDGLLTRLALVLWTKRPVSVQFRPVYALGTAVLVLAAMLLLGGPPQSGVDSQAFTVETAEPRLLVQFQFRAPGASSVQLAGSFSDWQPRYELVQTSPGSWTVTLPLPPGVHDYAFVVDGQQWLPDPFAPSVKDGFGGINSRLSLLPPEDARL